MSLIDELKALSSEELDESTAEILPIPLSELDMPAVQMTTNSDAAHLARMMTPIDRGNGKSTPGFRWWYESIIDWMLVNPGKPLSDCAAALGRNPFTVRMVCRSDAFRARYAERRAAFNKQMADQLTDAATRLALTSINELTERVMTNPAKIPIRDLADISNNVLERLGYGVKKADASAPVNVSVSVSSNVLAEAQEAMRAVQKAKTIEVTPNE